MKKVSLRQALKFMGYTIVQYKRGFNYRYGFMTKGEDFYYFNYQDLRDDFPTLLVRTADPNIKDRKGRYADWDGGYNTYPSQFSYGINIVELRKKCDFNSN